MKKWIIFVSSFIFLLVAVYAPMGQTAFSPGRLSVAHAFLKDDCQSCHTLDRSAKGLSCVPCHATNEALLQRQPTAFHANISTCSPCHIEHQGVGQRPVNMDHAALARIGLRELKDSKPGSNERIASSEIRRWVRDHVASGGKMGTLRMTREEAALNCMTCHGTKDKHRGVMGTDCASCHTTTQWTIAEFQHPSPRSVNCSQCHQPPKSHLMEHFKMVSAKIAKKPKARVNECYSCHETTAWNDIAGVGWYKHH